MQWLLNLHICKFHPHKIMMIQELFPRDCLECCQRVLAVIPKNNVMYFGDQAHINLSSYITKQNIYYWSRLALVNFMKSLYIKISQIYGVRFLVTALLARVSSDMITYLRHYHISVDMMRSLNQPLMFLVEEIQFQPNSATANTARQSIEVSSVTN